MVINFTRIFIAIIAFIILSLVIIVILQNKQLEHFAMLLDENITLTGTTVKTLPELDMAQCDDECKKNPACVAATIKSGEKGCWLKSTIGTTVSDNIMSSLRFPCELYDKIEFNGKGIGLDVGKYTLSDLQMKGYTEKSLRSIKLRDGYKVTIYDKDAFGGLSVNFTTSQPDLQIIVRDPSVEPSKRWSNAVSSVVVDKIY